MERDLSNIKPRKGGYAWPLNLYQVFINLYCVLNVVTVFLIVLQNESLEQPLNIFIMCVYSVVVLILIIINYQTTAKQTEDPII